MDHVHPFRLYRGTSIERAAFSPPAESFGMKFWDTEEDAIYRWDGTQWVLPSPRTDDWVGLNADGAASWQPDNVAVLHLGQITEYADPDDAFTAAVAGDVVLVPDGAWTLSASHAITSIDVAGIAGTRDGCILQANTDVGATLLTIDDGEISGVTVTYSTDNAAARTALKLIAATAASYAFNVRAECENDTGDAIGLWLDNSSGMNCRSSGTCNDSNNAIGVYLENGVIEYSRGDATNSVDGGARGIEIDTTGLARWCYSTGSAGLGFGYGIYLQGSANAWAYHCDLNGSDFDIHILALATLYVYSDVYDTVSNLGTLTHNPGDRAGIDRDETITGVWTFDEEITQAEQAADPGGPGAGYGRLYPKDDGAGQTKYFFMDDAANVYEIQGIVEDLTVTVGGAGDFATIQAAIDWFKNWIIKGACIISEIDSAAYDEQLDFAGLLIVPGSTLTLQGDTRVLAGVSYMVGSIANQTGLVNGGTWNAANRVTLTVDAVGDTITVSGGTVNPDFDADGWEPGDGVIIFGDDGVFYERVIDTVLNNVINITVALPGGSFPGGGGALGDGRAIGLKPDRSIELTAVGHCINVSGIVSGVVIDGWYLKSAFAGTGLENGVEVGEGGKIKLENVLTYVEDIGIRAFTNYGSIDASDGAFSAFNGRIGVAAHTTSAVVVDYATAVGQSQYSYYAVNQASLRAQYAIAGRAGIRGYFASCIAMVYADHACDRSSALAYYANTAAHLYAALTDANNTVPGVGNYDPVPAAIPGYANNVAVNSDTASIYAS